MGKYEEVYGIVLENKEGQRSVDVYDTREEAMLGYKKDRGTIEHHDLEGFGIYLSELMYDKSMGMVQGDTLINETSVLLYQS